METKPKKFTVEDAIAQVTGTERIDVLASLIGFNETVTVAQARDIANLFANEKTYQILHEVAALREALGTISQFNLSNTDFKLANDKIHLMKNIAKLALGEDPELNTYGR